MPIIDVKHASPLDEGQIERLISKLTDTYASETGANPDSVHVLVEAIATERWGVGGQSLAARRKS